MYLLRRNHHMSCSKRALWRGNECPGPEPRALRVVEGGEGKEPNAQ